MGGGKTGCSDQIAFTLLISKPLDQLLGRKTCRIFNDEAFAQAIENFWS
jgi:hypothetical protein